VASHEPQSFENHAKTVPGYHYVTFFFLVWFTVWAIASLVHLRAWDWSHVAFVMLALGLVGLIWYARLFANQNQDRIIRLEERLRMHELLPEDLRPRISEFTTGQLVALRFASDAELPALARRVLDEGLTDRKFIKQQIREWRPDHHRV